MSSAKYKKLTKKILSLKKKAKTAGILRLKESIMELLEEHKIIKAQPKAKPTHKTRYRLTEYGETIITQDHVQWEQLMKQLQSSSDKKIDKPSSSIQRVPTSYTTYDKLLKHFKPYITNLEARLTSLEKHTTKLNLILNHFDLDLLLETVILHEIKKIQLANPNEVVFPLAEIIPKIEYKGIQRPLLDKYLLRLEQRRLITLQSANDVQMIENPYCGIKTPERGILYYCSLN